VINIADIQKEKALVQQNIQNLETKISNLNSALQQTNANLLACRGAVLAFDRLLELIPKSEAPAPDAVALENGK
jgi:septal ring factor EnvC (AmiA/AmiB activator)